MNTGNAILPCRLEAAAPALFHLRSPTVAVVQGAVGQGRSGSTSWRARLAAPPTHSLLTTSVSNTVMHRSNTEGTWWVRGRVRVCMKAYVVKGCLYMEGEAYGPKLFGTADSPRGTNCGIVTTNSCNAVDPLVYV